ncbi:MAG: DegT/DnrJ/EryC1/StrS family aminotransferase [Rhodospirillales bacterium]|nr:DegT/DnrJ/EryC1/StrS family aminotransferase [Rhodospirillales bacterium]
MSTSERLALLGGTPVISKPFAEYQSMGKAEEEAVQRVVRSGCLSGFFGSPGPEFGGGPEVRGFEEAWTAHFGVAHTISVNSATSGLIAAMGAIGLSPGDEVIVPPWTMSASVAAPIFYGGIPVFCDIEAETFCIDPALVKTLITAKTKAIVAVNLFGHPARLAELRDIADTHGIYLIEDNAQAPLGSEHGRFSGTIGHIGIYSLNFHKHIHTGEGGMCVTNDDNLATRLRLIRNHGENCTEMLGGGAITNMLGMNLRMTEMSAAVGRVQLAGVDAHVEAREKIAHKLSAGLQGLAGLTPPVVRDGCRHNYYVWMMKIDEEQLGLSRALFSEALSAEGFPHATGYVAPLYRLPMFRERIAIGRDGWPFSLSERTYADLHCPVTEDMHNRRALLFEPCAYDLSDADVDNLIAAMRKVHAGRGQLNAHLSGA